MGLETFLAASHLWKAPLIVGSLCGGACGYLGPWIYFKRIIFVGLALAQVSALGKILGAVFGLYFGISGIWVSFLTSGIVALGLALFLAMTERKAKKVNEQFLAVSFIVSFALVIFLADLHPELEHELTQALFGSSLSVLPGSVLPIALSLTLILGTLVTFHKRLLFTVFDPEFAALKGLPVTFYTFLLYALIALVVMISAQAIGAMPIFSFGLFPVMAAKNLVKRQAPLFWLSGLLGFLSYGLGFCLSYAMDLASGASTALAPFFIYLFSFFVQLIPGFKTTRRIA